MFLGLVARNKLIYYLNLLTRKKKTFLFTNNFVYCTSSVV